jgi:hypothetical protein
MKTVVKLPHGGGAENGPSEWKDITPEAYRAMDLHHLIGELRKLPVEGGSVAIWALGLDQLRILALGVCPLRNDLLAWAEAERAKLKEVL